MFKELRKEKGFTQETLALELSVKQCTISSWENGNSKPDIPMAARIAATLRCDIADVVKCFMSNGGRGVETACGKTGGGERAEEGKKGEGEERYGKE